MSRMGEESGAYRFLVGKPEGKGPPGRHRLRWVDNIRMDLQEVGCNPKMYLICLLFCLSFQFLLFVSDATWLLNVS